MSCADVATAYGGTCYLDEQDYLQASGMGSNYAIKSGVENLTIYSGANPMYLNYQNQTSYDYVPIRIQDTAEGTNITANTFTNSVTPIWNNGTNTQIWLNHFYDYAPVNLTPTSYCVGGEGNFYKETITNMPTTDCGQANITIPAENEEKNNTFDITWKKQSSILQVFYELFIKKIGQAFSFLGLTNSTNYSLDTSAYNDSSYTIKIIPYVNNSRVNATAVYRNFTINNIPQIPILTSPAAEEIVTSRKPLFSWNRSSNEEGTVYYNLLVDNDYDFSSPEINVTVTSTNYSSSSGLYFDDYFWKVNANDTVYVSNFSETRNFTLIKNIACTMLVSSVNFSQIYLNEVKNTTTEASPLVIENSGNLKLNISVNATNLWQYFPNPSKYYQYMIGVNETGAFESALNDSWYNFSNQAVISIAGLNYADTNDTARVDVQIEAPEGEGAGKKTSMITFWCEEDE
jgi:hypothetical protein